MGNEGVDTDFRGVGKTVGLRALNRIGLSFVDLCEGFIVELTVGHAIGNGTLQEIIAIDTHLHRADIVGHLERIASFFIGHGRVLVIIIGGHDDTHQWLLGSCIDNLSRYSLTVLLCCHRQRYEQQNSGKDIFLHCSSDFEVRGLR